ncbi:hypothetical protein ACFWJS_42025, partial [Streptomyces sp. NPDC127061]
LVKAPLVLVWDRLNTHVSHVMRELIAQRTWLKAIARPMSPSSCIYDRNTSRRVLLGVKRGSGQHEASCRLNSEALVKQQHDVSQTGLNDQ